MAMEEALLARLRAAAGLKPLFRDRWDWFDRPRVSDDDPRDTLPAGSLTSIDPGEEWTHDGPDGLDEARVRFELWARDKLTLVKCKRALRAEMHQSADVAGWRFHPASLELERFDTDEGEGDSETLFRVTMDYLFFHEEISA